MHTPRTPHPSWLWRWSLGVRLIYCARTCTHTHTHTHTRTHTHHAHTHTHHAHTHTTTVLLLMHAPRTPLPERLWCCPHCRKEQLRVKAGLRLMPTSVHVAFNFVAHARTTHPTPSALMHTHTHAHTHTPRAHTPQQCCCSCTHHAPHSQRAHGIVPAAGWNYNAWRQAQGWARLLSESANDLQRRIRAGPGRKVPPQWECQRPANDLYSVRSCKFVQWGLRAGSGRRVPPQWECQRPAISLHSSSAV